MNIEEYEHGGRALYADFAAEVGEILRAAISEKVDLRLQSIQFRAKDTVSLRVKLARANAKPEDRIADIAKDVAGCRLIFYTNSDVYRFGQSGILRDNFIIDYERSKIHYPQNSDDDVEFFISENWVVELTEARCALPEYRRFAGLRCEIQVQTILDHAWAEMAHDTIYKPMSDEGFGAGAVDAMRKRLRKVMRDYLQPAGYEFQKIASDYSRLREGKSMFDEDALAVIRACQDRNCLHDAIERFENHVLPHYNDYRSWGPEIIEVHLGCCGARRGDAECAAEDLFRRLSRHQDRGCCRENLSCAAVGLSTLHRSQPDVRCDRRNAHSDVERGAKQADRRIGTPFRAS